MINPINFILGPKFVSLGITETQRKVNNHLRLYK